jgi:pyruvate kinase
VQIVGKTATEVTCVVLEGGEFKSRRHLNVQGRTANLPSLTPKDWDDLEFGVEQGVDFFAMSFVHDAKVCPSKETFREQSGPFQGTPSEHIGFGLALFRVLKQ